MADADTTVADSPDPGALSAAEVAYLQSGGEKTEGLFPAEDGGTQPSPEAKPSDADTAKPSPDGAVKPAETQGADAATVTDPDERIETFDENGKPDPKGRFVRYGALHESRARLKETAAQLEKDRTELAKARELQARLDERLRIVAESEAALSAAEQPKPEVDVKPDPNDDIFGAVKWQDRKIAELEAKLAQAGERTGKIETAEQQREREQAIARTYIADAQEFIQKTPDFLQAYEFMKAQRDAVLIEAGIADPNERARAILMDEKALVENAIRSGISPTERVYRIAKAAGYRPAAAAPAADPAARSNGAQTNGTATNGAGAPSPSTTPAATVSDEIARIAAGQNAARSTTTAGGSTPTNDTLESVLAMPQDEFIAWSAKNPRKLQALMGSGSTGSGLN